MQARVDPRHRPAIWLISAAGIVATVSAAASVGLSHEQQDWALTACTAASVVLGTSLFWLTDRSVGWIGACALLLAVTPLAVHQAASDLFLGEHGRLEKCLLVSVQAQQGPTDVLPTIRYRQQLSCATSGQREVVLARPLAEAGTSLSLWVDGRTQAVSTRPGAAPHLTGSFGLAFAVLLGLAVSGAATVRRRALPAVSSP